MGEEEGEIPTEDTKVEQETEIKQEWDPTVEVYTQPQDPGWARGEENDQENDWARDAPGGDWGEVETKPVEPILPSYNLPTNITQQEAFKACRKVINEIRNLPSIQQEIVPKTEGVTWNCGVGMLRNKYTRLVKVLGHLKRAIPVTANSDSYQAAYYNIVMEHRRCEHDTNWYAPETYCYGCNVKVLELEKLWKEDRMKAGIH
jgi:hypothetical protein